MLKKRFVNHASANGQTKTSVVFPLSQFVGLYLLKTSNISANDQKTWSIHSCAALLKRPICIYSLSQRKWFSFELIINADSFSSISTNRECRRMYHDNIMLKQTISISSCLKVAIEALFCITKPRKNLKED